MEAVELGPGNTENFAVLLTNKASEDGLHPFPAQQNDKDTKFSFKLKYFFYFHPV